MKWNGLLSVNAFVLRFEWWKTSTMYTHIYTYGRSRNGSSIYSIYPHWFWICARKIIANHFVPYSFYILMNAIDWFIFIGNFRWFSLLFWEATSIYWRCIISLKHCKTANIRIRYVLWWLIRMSDNLIKWRNLILYIPWQLK